MHASPRGVATLCSGATPTRTPTSWTPGPPRAAEVRASGSRRDAVPNPRGASRKGRQKGDGGTFGRASSPIIDAPQAPEIMAAKPTSPLPTHTADVTTTTRGAGSLSPRCTARQKIRNQAGFRPSRMARPGLEPGTPRFSVATSGAPERAKSVEINRYRCGEDLALKFAVCGLFRAVQEMSGVHLLHRRLRWRAARCARRVA